MGVVGKGLVVDRRGVDIRTAWSRPGGKGLRTSCSLRFSERRPPAKLPGLTVASPGSRGEAGRSSCGHQFSLAARAGTLARASGPRPSTPWPPGWAQRYGPAALRLAWEGRRTLPCAGGAGASAAREPRTVRIGKAEDGVEAEARGRRRRGEPRLLAGRWSRPRSWRALAPALTLESLGGGRDLGPKGPGWETGLRGQREARRCSGGLGAGSGLKECSRRSPASPRLSLGSARRPVPAPFHRTLREILRPSLTAEMLFCPFQKAFL